jgi:hypothetical protein
MTRDGLQNHCVLFYWSVESDMCHWRDITDSKKGDKVENWSVAVEWRDAHLCVRFVRGRSRRACIVKQVRIRSKRENEIFVTRTICRTSVARVVVAIGPVHHEISKDSKTATRDAYQQFKQHHARRPPVDHRTIGALQQHLGGKVVGRSCVGSSSNVRGRFAGAEIRKQLSAWHEGMRTCA